MSITVNFECAGCFKKVAGTAPLYRRTEPVLGGLVRHLAPDIQSVAPEGWIAFDPNTGCCYCPECSYVALGEG